MSETDDAEDIDSIREQKTEELAERVATADEPIHVEDATHFEELLETHSPILVDFYADWCGPCQMIAPVLEDLAADTDGTIAKVDVDAQQDLAGQHQVQSIPTLILFVDGEPAERLVGAQDRERLETVLQRAD